MKQLDNGKQIFIESEFYQLYKNKQHVCGDVFLQHKIKDEDRIISVLSDGLGSGIKANVLATLTATMAINFISHSKGVRSTAETIMKTLPVCKVRKISYSTFTIVDIDKNGLTKIIEYDTPPFLLIRNNQLIQVKSTTIELKYHKNKEDVLIYSEFTAQMGDRIIFFSDGVSQAGMGTKQMPLGWGNESIACYVLNSIKNNNDISARDLAKEIAAKAHFNDGYKPKDDITAGVIYFRKPRKLMLLTGPPFSPLKDAYIAKEIDSFDGKKVICGGTTAKIVSRELNRAVRVDMSHMDDAVPPCCTMAGIDLITEGTYTLGKVMEILENDSYNSYTEDNGVSKLCNFLLNSDIICFVVGTRINQAHQDPNIPIELGIRRNLIKNITKLLEEKFLKEIVLQYL
ncbi:MAG: SpoIIE family protein phosphatase [Bacteroidota bacterium]|nr:SpoIIE family protein phosphatase [Bacteroidota bacterium]